MFRTIRDLLLRPGYMIRDYLQGMQMAYFPPFKLLFLIIALSLLVQTGLNIKGVNRIDESIEMIDKATNFSKEQDKNANEKQVTADYHKEIIIWTYKHMTIVTLVFLLFFSGPLYFFFRHSPNIPDMRFSEFFVSVIYFTNMTSIYSIIWEFFCGNIYLETLLSLLAIIPLKQLSGYGYWHTIWRTLLAFILFWIIIFFVGAIVSGVIILINMIR